MDYLYRCVFWSGESCIEEEKGIWEIFFESDCDVSYDGCGFVFLVF